MSLMCNERGTLHTQIIMKLTLTEVCYFLDKCIYTDIPLKWVHISTCNYMVGYGCGFVCLTPLSTLFQLYRVGQFYWWKKPEYPKKLTDMSHVNDKLSHVMLYRTFISP